MRRAKVFVTGIIIGIAGYASSSAEDSKPEQSGVVDAKMSSATSEMAVAQKLKSIPAPDLFPSCTAIELDARKNTEAMRARCMDETLYYLHRDKSDNRVAPPVRSVPKAPAPKPFDPSLT